MKTSAPWFSVIIPCHNRVLLLRDAITSCLRQSFSDIEVIVIDDSSTDNIKGLCESFRDARLTCIRNQTNVGAAASRNRGLQISRSKYVSFLDSDDLLLQDRFSILAELVRLENPAVICHRQFRFRTREIDTTVPELLPRYFPSADEHLAEHIFKGGNWIPINTWAIRADIAKSFRFDTELVLWTDTKFLIQIWMEHPNFAYIPDILSVYFDDLRPQRYSDSRSETHHLGMLKYLEEHSSRASVLAFKALAMADAIFWRHPLKATGYILAAYKAGVSAGRSIFYVARCIIGYQRTKWIQAKMASLRKSIGRPLSNGSLDPMRQQKVEHKKSRI